MGIPPLLNSHTYSVANGDAQPLRRIHCEQDKIIRVVNLADGPIVTLKKDAFAVATADPGDVGRARQLLFLIVSLPVVTTVVVGSKRCLER